MRKPKKTPRSKTLGLKVTPTQYATFVSVAKSVETQGKGRTKSELLEMLLEPVYGLDNVRARKAGPIAKTPSGVVRLLLAEALVRLSQEAGAIAESVEEDPRSAEEILDLLRKIDGSLIEIAQQVGLRTGPQT